MFNGPKVAFLNCLRRRPARLWTVSKRRSHHIPTIQEIRERLQRTVGSALGNKTAATSPKDQNVLKKRRMKDSYYEAVIPLSDKVVRDKYKGLYDNVRLGQLLENLDTFAVHISYLHNSPSSVENGGSSLSIVTAMVDEIKIHDNAFEIDRDIILKGHVSWVGQSSMEIKMWVLQHEKPTIDATFVMVARDFQNKSAAVHPLEIDDEDERILFDEGERHKIERLEEKKYSLLKHPPNEEEKQIIHDLFTQTLDPQTMSFRSRRLPDGCVWMEGTKLKNLIVCFPEKRNIHNKIFGGFLMRKGFELAWANACVFSRTRPYIHAVDDILFRCPVPIGSLLLISSQVCYSKDRNFHIRAHAEVMDPRSGESNTCNTFNFSFTCDQLIPTVMPKTYGEAMLYLDGKRHNKSL